MGKVSFSTAEGPSVTVEDKASQKTRKEVPKKKKKKKGKSFGQRSASWGTFALGRLSLDRVDRVGPWPNVVGSAAPEFHAPCCHENGGSPEEGDLVLAQPPSAEVTPGLFLMSSVLDWWCGGRPNRSSPVQRVERGWGG